MTIDFNDANEQRADGVVPDGTFCGLHMTIRPGGENIEGCSEADLGLFKASLSSDVSYLDCELTVISGPHAGRKLFQPLTVSGGKLNESGVSKGWNISKDLIRAMIDSSYGLDPKDMSEAAKAKRVLRGFRDLDGIEFFARLGVERGSETPDGGQYPDRNRIAHVVVPGELHYPALKAGHEVAPAPSAAKADGAARPAAPPAQAKPPWQQAAPAAATPPAAGPSWLKGDKK
jgi:hypothetical protein